MKKLLFLLMCMIMSYNTTFASHFQGGNITYDCLGGNQYRITFTQFFDCGTYNVSQAGTTIPISITNDCGLANPALTLTNTTPYLEVSQLCGASLPGSECSGGGQPGVFMAQWSAIVNLPGACNSWHFSYSTCCWNVSNNAPSTPGQLYTTSLNNTATVGGCDDSPIITGQQIPYICAGQTTTYSLGVSDPDGNNLQYQLVPALENAYPGTAMAYNPGFTGPAPIPGMTINPATGLITVTPTVTGNYIIAVNINSYNAAGQLIGTIHHQFQIVVINCSNQVPQPPAGGLSSVTGANLTAPNAITFCRGTNGCFNVVFTDANAANILTLTSNVAVAMPGATMTVAGTNPATATICWNPTAASPANASITITAEDNACPIAGLNSYNVDVTVGNCCLPPTMSSTPSCTGGTGGTATAQGNGSPNYSYTWVNTGTGATVATHTGMAGASTITGLAPGTYQVTVIDATGCNTTGTVTVGTSPSPTIAVTNATVCSGNPATITATPSAGGGTYLWSTGATTNSITETPGTTTTYNVTYTLSGCSVSGSGTITVNPTPTVAVNSETICNGETATITATPSITGGSYSWTGGLPATQSVSVTPSTTTSYTVTYTLTGCTATATSTITVNPVPVLNVNSETICAGTSATLTAVPTVTGGTFTWGGGETTASITVSPATTTSYTVDYTVGGCDATTVTSTVTVVNNPVADFSPTMVCQGTPTQFTDESTAGVDTWSYDFDDGTPIDNNQNPIHTYATDGIYNVTLTVVTDGCTGTATIPVTVNAMPAASFTSTPACPTSNTTFDASASAIPSGSITDFDWTFTGATPASGTGMNTSTVYASGGTYTVELVVTSNQGCTDTMTQNIIIPYMPVPDFTFTEECEGNSTCFTDASTVTGATITGWTWVWDDGLPVGNTQNPCHLYAAAGTYNVTLIPTSSEGCTGPSVAYDVPVNGNPVASFTVSNVCQSVAAAFNNTSTGSPTVFDWTFDDGTPNSSLEDPTHSYATLGTYNVTLNVSTAAGCSHSVTNPVTIYPQPTAGFTFTSVCEDVMTSFTSTSAVPAPGAIATYSWNFGDAGTAAVANPTHQYAGDGNYNVTLTVTTADGCTDNITLPAASYPLPELNFTPTDVCLGTATTYQNLSTIPSGSISTYNWDFGDGGTSAAVNPTYTYTAIGAYNVTLTGTSNHGCVTTDVIVVNVHPNPVVAFSTDINAACSPLCVQLTSSSTIATGTIATLAWDYGDGTNAAGTTVNKCYVNPDLSTDQYNITLTATSDQGCVTTLTMPNYLTVYPIPVADFTAVPQTVSILTPQINFVNTSLGASTASWQFGDFDSSNVYNPMHEYAEPGVYNVLLTVTSVNGCVDTISHPLEILPEFLLYVPNAFTPDGDGKNDLFAPFIQGHDIDTYEWFVFNRWGDVIFESHFSTNMWDGTHNGVKAKEDVYVWKIKVKDIATKEKKEINGHVTLLR